MFILFYMYGLFFLLYMTFNKSQIFAWENKNVVFLCKGIKQIISGKLWQLAIAIGTCGELMDRLPILPSFPTTLAKVHNQKNIHSIPLTLDLNG